MGVPSDSIDNKAVAERLKRLREHEGIETQTQMAVELQIDFDRYNTAERGLGLSNQVAIRICRRFSGVSLDWLYFGKEDLLPVGLAKSLGGVPRPKAGTPTARKPGRRS